MRTVPGIVDLGLFKTLGQPDVKITPDREAIARYGLNTGDVANVVQSALGGLTGIGSPIVEVYEAEKFFDLTVRWKEQYRSSIEAIREITVSTPSGAVHPARADREDRAGHRSHDNLPREPAALRAREVRRARSRSGGRHRGRAEAASRRRSRCPYGMHLEWEGEIQELKSVEKRLMLDHPADHPAHRLRRLHRRRQLARHDHHPHRHPRRMHGRRARAADRPGRTSRCRPRWGSSRSSASPSRTPC